MSALTKGVVGGVLLQLYSNGVRKLPLMRRTFFPLSILFSLSYPPYSPHKKSSFFRKILLKETDKTFHIFHPLAFLFLPTPFLFLFPLQQQNQSHTPFPVILLNACYQRFLVYCIKKNYPDRKKWWLYNINAILVNNNI